MELCPSRNLICSNRRRSCDRALRRSGAGRVRRSVRSQSASPIARRPTRSPSRPARRHQLPAFGKRPQQTAVLDLGRYHPGVDSVLNPEWNSHGSDSAALSAKIGEDPSALPHLDTFNVQTRQLLPSQAPAQQQRQNRVVPLAFDLGAVRHREELLGLFPREPVPHPGSLLREVGNAGEVGGLFRPIDSVARASPTSLRTADNRTRTSRSAAMLQRRPVLHQKCARERPSARTEGKHLIEGLGIVALGVCWIALSPAPSLATWPEPGSSACGRSPSRSGTRTRDALIPPHSSPNRFISDECSIAHCPRPQPMRQSTRSPGSKQNYSSLRSLRSVSISERSFCHNS